MESLKKEPLCGKKLDEIQSILTGAGFSSSHAWQVSISLHRKQRLIPANEFAIPAALRKFLKENFETGIIKHVQSVKSIDHTVKYLFSGHEGRLFEAVYIPDNKRHTVCVSTQSGCRMGCPFCVTGSYGFHGNLSPQEIISQVIGIPEAALITHVVFMGMGEPLDNLASTLNSVEILTSPWGLSLSNGHVTVSTVGVYSAVTEFLGSSKCNLTLSLFSPFSDERRRMIPAESANPAIEIIKFIKNTKATGRRRFTIAYMMVKGVNDTQRHLDELKILLSGTGIRVNIIPYHSFKGAGMEPSSPDLMAKFRHELTISGVSASIRKSRGEDISAACGLLASELKNTSGL